MAPAQVFYRELFEIPKNTYLRKHLWTVSSVFGKSFTTFNLKLIIVKTILVYFRYKLQASLVCRYLSRILIIYNLNDKPSNFPVFKKNQTRSKLIDVRREFDINSIFSRKLRRHFFLSLLLIWLKTMLLILVFVFLFKNNVTAS